MIVFSRCARGSLPRSALCALLVAAGCATPETQPPAAPTAEPLQHVSEADDEQTASSVWELSRELRERLLGPIDTTVQTPITASVDGTIVAVERGDDHALAVIDVGRRDGVQRGWVMTIGHDRTFIARLRIIHVEPSNAVGVIDLEDAETRGLVECGHRAYAR